MNILCGIRKGYSLKSLALVVMVLTVANTLISCSNEEDKIPVYSLKDVEGYYIGTMQTVAITKSTANESKVNAWATIHDNFLTIDEFPVSDLIKSLITDPDAAEAIITAVGKIQYKMPYEATFDDNKDIIALQFTTEPLVLEIPMATQMTSSSPVIQEAAPTLSVKVTIKAEQEGEYTYDTNTLKFTIQATEVTVNNAPFTFPPTAFTFEMTRHDFLEI